MEVRLETEQRRDKGGKENRLEKGCEARENTKKRSRQHRKLTRNGGKNRDGTQER